VPREAFIDHLTIPVRDVAVSRRFYEAALGPFNIETAVIEGAVGFGPSGSVDFFVREGEPAAPVHLAFAAGGRDNGAPGLRPRYHADYYGGYVIDPDGHNVEAVCHRPEG